MKHVEIDGKDVSDDQGQTKVGLTGTFFQCSKDIRFSNEKFTFSNSGLDTGICNGIWFRFFHQFLNYFIKLS